MMFDNTTILSTLIILLLAAVSVLLRKLTLLAGIAGSLLGIVLWEAFHYTGMLMLGSFFLLGSIATGWKASQKTKLFSSASLEEERRTTGQVLANGGIAGILALFALFFPEQKQCLQLMMAGSFAAALSDTFSSEFGNVYGKRFYNVCTFRKDQRGENGVISWEGSIAGIAGAGIIALLFFFIQDCSSSLVILLIAGISGNLVDSLLGAKFERSGLIGNNLVNFLNTGTGAGVAWAVLAMLNVEF